MNDNGQLPGTSGYPGLTLQGPGCWLYYHMLVSVWFRIHTYRHTHTHTHDTGHSAGPADLLQGTGALFPSSLPDSHAAASLCSAGLEKEITEQIAIKGEVGGKERETEALKCSLTER